MEILREPPSQQTPSLHNESLGHRLGVGIADEAHPVEALPLGVGRQTGEPSRRLPGQGHGQFVGAGGLGLLTGLYLDRLKKNINFSSDYKVSYFY